MINIYNTKSKLCIHDTSMFTRYIFVSMCGIIYVVYSVETGFQFLCQFYLYMCECLQVN